MNDADADNNNKPFSGLQMVINEEIKIGIEEW